MVVSEFTAADRREGNRLPRWIRAGLWSLLLWNATIAGSATYEIPGSMIEIAVNIYEYRLDNEHQLGLFYQYNSKKGSIENSQLFLPGTENVRDQPIPALNVVTSVMRSKYGELEINLKAAIEEGRATVISNPTILTADGQKSMIVSGEEVPLTVLKSTGYQTMLSTETRPTGIKFIVTPRIYGNNNILMDLEIESSEITQFNVFDRGDKMRFELPVVSKRNIKSVVIIPSEQQLYIGGLYTNNYGDLVRKVPIAGDIPVLGFFLRGTNKQKRQSETVFQLTPTIRPPGAGVSSEDTIFDDILRPDTKTKIIDKQNVLDEAERSSPFQGMIPGPGPDQIPGASSIPSASGPVGSATAPLTLPSDTTSAPAVSGPVSDVSSPQAAPVEPTKPAKKSNKPNRFNRFRNR